VFSDYLHTASIQNQNFSSPSGVKHSATPLPTLIIFDGSCPDHCTILDLENSETVKINFDFEQPRLMMKL
jgi:hypothetical protein